VDILLAVALVGVFLIHRGARPERRERLLKVLRPALKWGGVAFAVGFIGPMILAPGANQGPMLGIFITGPLGFLGGLVYGFARGS